MLRGDIAQSHITIVDMGLEKMMSDVDVLGACARGLIEGHLDRGLVVLQNRCVHRKGETKITEQIA
jgi:hypothetical protein